MALATPATIAATPGEPPFLPIVVARRARPSAVLSSGPGASSYRINPISFPAPLLTGGFNDGSRFVAALLAVLPTASVLKPGVLAADAPGSTQGPPPASVSGGRSAGASSGGDRGIGVDTPIGRVSISRDGYQFGRWRYPLASVRGIATTVLISLAAHAGVAALLGGVSAGAAIVRRRRTASSSEPVADPELEPATVYEGWDL